MNVLLITATGMIALYSATNVMGPKVTPEKIIDEVTKQTEITEEKEFIWEGPVLNSVIGTVEGPSGKETYFRRDMSYVIQLMEEAGYDMGYWVRDDGVKMYGEYVMCAANLDIRPKGTILETSLGTGIVCDTGEFAVYNPYQIDIAVTW